MSKRQGLASKLFAVLGGAGLAIGICATRASAQAKIPPPWTNANFDNRYICSVSSDANQFTGVMKINPSGTGVYTAGTLNASLSPFATFNNAATPPANFCSYALNTRASGYAVGSKGIGTDVLSWTFTAGNAACPPSFVMSDTFVIRNNITANKTVPRTDFTSNNFLGQHASTVAPQDPGYGQCLK